MSKRFFPKSSHDPIVIHKPICKSQYGSFEIRSYDAMGNLVQSHEQPIDSFVLAYVHWWFNRMGNSLSNTFVALDGTTSRTLSSTSSNAKGGLGSYCGIIVGSGTTAPVFDDVTLDTIIIHGSSAGQLIYDPCDTISSDPSGTHYVSRTFRNNSGGSVTIRECGIAVTNASEGGSNNTNLNAYVMYVRDVLGSDVVVPDGGYASVLYKTELASGRTINYFRHLLTYPLGTTGTASMGWYDSAGALSDGSSLTVGTPLSGGVADDTMGIVLSTSSAADTYLTYDVADRITNGTGAGQLLFFATDSGNTNIDIGAGTAEMFLVREVFNDSASAITVNSVGLRFVARSSFATGVATFDRQLLSVPITINPQTGRTFVYRFCYQF